MVGVLVLTCGTAVYGLNPKSAVRAREAGVGCRRTVLSTETRIKCFGRAALWKFRFYWSLVGPFSGLIRKVILKQVKTEAESTVTQAS
jgi:hypothetical protein